MDQQANRRSRLYGDVSADLRRRVRLAAAREDTTIHAYVVRSWENPLHRDECADEADTADQTDRLVERLLQLRQRAFPDGILAEDSVETRRAQRSERNRGREDGRS